MSVWDIILICLAAAAIIYFAVISVILRVRAKKAGIIRVKRPVKTESFVIMVVCAALSIMVVIARAVDCAEYKKTMGDVQRLGFQRFHKEYYNWDVTPIPPVDEQSSTEELFAEYRKKYDRERHAMEIQACSAIFFTASALLNGAYITKQGVYMFGDIKPKETAAKIEDGMLCFQSQGKHEYTMLKLPASEENLRLYSEFITEGKA
ncbi:MAG: hypothetical protein K2N38_10120 [Oscillospiraceae bacterium]|nr:hypothetical protein [Oscillospiraceae bacterium]